MQLRAPLADRLTAPLGTFGPLDALFDVLVAEDDNALYLCSRARFNELIDAPTQSRNIERVVRFGCHRADDDTFAHHHFDDHSRFDFVEGTSRLHMCYFLSPSRLLIFPAVESKAVVGLISLFVAFFEGGNCAAFFIGVKFTDVASPSNDGARFGCRHLQRPAERAGCVVEAVGALCRPLHIFLDERCIPLEQVTSTPTPTPCPASSSSGIARARRPMLALMSTPRIASPTKLRPLIQIPRQTSTTRMTMTSRVRLR